MDGRKQQHYFPFYKIFNGLSDSTSFQRRLLLSFLFIAIPVISGVLVIAFFIIQFSTHETVTQTQATELEKTSAQLEFILSGRQEHFIAILVIQSSPRSIFCKNLIIRNIPLFQAESLTLSDHRAISLIHILKSFSRFFFQHYALYRN